jgi:Protein of unknown function (DUF5672)
MKKIVTLIPVYKTRLDDFENFSLSYSLARLSADRAVFFIAPESIEQGFYFQHYPQIPFIFFESHYFQSIVGYNHLLLNPAFYQQFIDYEFMLILQTDAILLRDDLDYWCGQPFDYVGAPWPDGYELYVNAGRFEGDNGKRVKVHVGNGGLSLRRLDKTLSLLKEFNEIVQLFESTGSSEDLFFSVMAALSNDFIVPNEMIASRFSMELSPTSYLKLNGGRLPMGGHAWWKYEPEFWLKLFDYRPSVYLSLTEA